MKDKEQREDRLVSPAEGIDDLAGSIVDGKLVDWNRPDTDPALDESTMRALRDLERFAEFNRELQLIPSTPAMPHVLAGGETQRWGDLTLLEMIGSGARGEVWRAWDPALQRDVALKFLQPSSQAAGGARPALLMEARAVARVRHPGVVTVHGIAEHEGRVGMWMEYLRGATLAQEIERRGALTASEVARIGYEVCSALQAVHSAGLVHRDIKPANIIVESGGRVVLTDFGLGMRPELTDQTAPRSSGTPIFMSPEVLAGGPATPQSDLYALGVTLLWALAGRPPFEAKTLDALKEEASRGPSAVLQSVRRASPRGLVSSIEWAISPSAAVRPRNASDLSARLRLVLEEITRRRLHSRAALVIVAALGAIAIAFALMSGRVSLDHPMGGSPSIAVLPLVNLSGDPNQEYFTDGMTEELIARFAEIGDLRVISRSSVMPFKNSREPLPEIAKKLHVKMVVEGSVSGARDSVRISARLVDPGSGRALWAGTFDGDWSDVLALQSDVAKAVVQRVEARVTPRERARLARAPEVNPEAHRLYLQGLAALRLMTSDGIRRAIALFHNAIDIEPKYAEPWIGLSSACDFAVAVGVLSEQESAAQSLAAARRALELDPGSGPARAAIAGTQLDFDWDFKGAERGYREALALSPGDSDARSDFVTLLVMTGQFDEAVQQAKRARELDPVSLDAGAVSMFPLYEARRYGDCVRVGREILAAHPNAPWILLVMGQALFLEGKRDEGIHTIEGSLALDRIPPGVGWLGFAYGRAGKTEQARSVLGELKQMQQRTYIDPYYFAIVHLGLGERSHALDYIEQAGLTHSPEAKLLQVDPILDPLRSDPRFHALLSQLGMQG